MDELNAFLEDFVPDERRELIEQALDILEENNYQDHQFAIQEAVSYLGSIETTDITYRIETVVRQSLQHLLLFHYIRIDDNQNLMTILELFAFLELLEYSLESEVIVYYHNTELEPKDQMLSWLEFFDPSFAEKFDEMVLDVRETLINNIVELHNNKIGIEEMEYDGEFHHRLKLYKDTYSRKPEIGVYVHQMLKNNRITKRMNQEDLYKLFKEIVYRNQDVPSIGVGLLGVCLFANVKLETLRDTTNSLAKNLFVDIEKLTVIDADIGNFLRTENDLCKSCPIS